MTNPDVKLSDQDYIILKSFINELTNGEPIKEEGLAPNELIIGDEQPATQNNETTAPASKNSNPFKEERWVDTIKNTGESVKSGAQSVIDFLNKRPAEPGGLLYNSQNKPLADNELIIGENKNVIGDAPKQLAPNELIIGDGNNYEKPVQNYNGNSIEEIVNDILYSRPVGENGILNKNKPGALNQRATQYEDKERSFTSPIIDFLNTRPAEPGGLLYNNQNKPGSIDQRAVQYEDAARSFNASYDEYDNERDRAMMDRWGTIKGTSISPREKSAQKATISSYDVYDNEHDRAVMDREGVVNGTIIPPREKQAIAAQDADIQLRKETPKDSVGKSLDRRSSYDYGSEQAQMGYKSSVNDSFTIDDYISAAEKVNSKPSASNRIGLPQNIKEVTRQIPESEINSERTRAQLGDGYLDALAEAIKNNDTSANYYAQALESLGYTKEQIRFALNGRYNIKI